MLYKFGFINSANLRFCKKRGANMSHKNLHSMTVIFGTKVERFTGQAHIYINHRTDELVLKTYGAVSNVRLFKNMSLM